MAHSNLTRKPPILVASNPRCDPSSLDEDVDGDVHFIRYNRCAEGAEIQLYWLEGSGHTWPGGRNYAIFGGTSDDLFATEFIWDFFESHSLPERYIQQ